MNSKNIRKFLIFIFLVVCLGISLIFSMSKTYSYGYTYKITGTSGSRVLHYIDSDSGTEIDFETAVKYYDAPNYVEIPKASGNLYFYKAKETDEATYKKGSSIEAADRRARDYGEYAFRVKTKQQAYNVIDNMVNNLIMGTIRLEFSPYEPVTVEDISLYYNSKYGVYGDQNYYPYSLKGPIEPTRSGLEYERIQEGEIEIYTHPFLRLTSGERTVAENMVNELLPLLQGNGTDYEKIGYAYNYINNHTTYLVDQGYVNDLIESNTSIYDVFVTQKSVCIGYSIAFSYLMDKMGIESYIVDSISNSSGENFASNHSYNIVKLDGKFYTVDLTARSFLTGVSSNSLKGNVNLPLSSSSYNLSGKRTNFSIDESKVTTIINKAKNTNVVYKEVAITTTNKYIYGTTSVPKTNKTTTNNNTNTNKTTTKSTTTTTRTNESGEIIYPETTETISNIINETTTTNHPGDPIDTNKKENELNLNYILIPLSIVVIVFYLIYKSLHKKSYSVNNDEIDMILKKNLNSHVNRDPFIIQSNINQNNNNNNKNNKN